MVRYLIFIVYLLIISYANPVLAEIKEGGAGFFKSINGEVLLLRDDSELKVQPGQQILSSDTVLTGGESTAAIIFQDGTRMTLGAQSELEVQKYEFQPHQKKYDFILLLKKGTVIYSSGKLGKLAPEKINLKTPRATVGIRGTRLLLSVK